MDMDSICANGLNGLAIYKDRDISEVIKIHFPLFSALRVKADVMAPSSGDMAVY